MRSRRARSVIIMGAVSTAVIGAIALAAHAEPTYVSELTFAPENPTFDPHGEGTAILGDVTVTREGWLDFSGRSVVQTPDRPDLNPGNADFRFGARIALTHGVGDWNVMQKAYWSDQQWKLSTHSSGGAARLSCRFSGSLGAVHVFTDAAVIPTDGSWHDVACVRARDTVRVEVDGAVVAEGSGPIGSIVSTKPYLIGSKGMDMASPDQFLGLLDDAYVIRDDNPPPVNHAPTAAVKVSGCDKLVCTVDASGSTDPDGDPLTLSWDFGDGDDTSNLTDVQVTHEYPADGTYPVTVTVQDPAGKKSTATTNVKALSADAQVGFRAASGALTNSKAITAMVPGSVQVGDELLLFVVANRSDVTLATPPGWTSLGRQVDESMQSQVWSRDAVASDAGSSVRVTVPATAKMTATVLAYSSTGATPPTVTAASAAEARKTAAHVTPVAATSARSWVVSMWADKSGSTSSWLAPTPGVVRQFLAGTSTAHVTSLVADSGGPVGAASGGGLTATASSASGIATMWTVVVSPS